MTNRMFLVVGPESSGNRLLAGVLIKAGCVGVAGVNQEWADCPPPPGLENPVVIRSFPHGGETPDLTDLYESGYEVVTLVTVRHPKAVILSQVKQGHVDSVEQAFDNVQKAYKDIFAAIQGEFHLIPYEAITHPDRCHLWGVLFALGLPEIMDFNVTIDEVDRPIINQNEKHWYNG